MNIIEAVKSGKIFKRKADIEYNYNSSLQHDAWYQFNTRDILADDWEIEERTITITENAVDAAWEIARHLNSEDGVLRSLKDTLFKTKDRKS